MDSDQVVAALDITSVYSDASSDEYVAPIRTPHFRWNCKLLGPHSKHPMPVNALIDHGSSMVMIDQCLADELRLQRQRLPKPVHIRMAVGEDNRSLHEFVNITPISSCSTWQSKPLRALVVPSLCTPLLLGGPFLVANEMVLDHSSRTCVSKGSNFDILRPATPVKKNESPKKKAIRQLQTTVTTKKLALTQLQQKLSDKKKLLDDTHSSSTSTSEILASIHRRITQLASLERLNKLDGELREDFKSLFADKLPHVDLLPHTVYHEFKLKDASKIIESRSYPTPRKYRDAWETLISEHVKAGRLRVSSSKHASPAFLVAKSDPKALPRLVCDQRALNDNTEADKYPLPRVEDILADCTKGKIWAKIDMTNAFFQTRMRPDQIPLTAIKTPLGLYEWTVMPMGCKNAPATHQRRMETALRGLIGKVCHVYLDDIVVWSDTIKQHRHNLRLVLSALRNAGLICSPNKTQLFCSKLSFLGHIISQKGIEPDPSKTEKVRAWPRPASATAMRSFLGLVRYLDKFLPKLADHSRILNSFTTKEAEKTYPPWTEAAQNTFNGIKGLVTNARCLTTIDHQNPGENRIFLHTDASHFRTGAVLSFGPSPETARPVAFDSIALTGPQLNYPVHDKELLAIVRALKKFRADLIGEHFTIFTDHQPLKYFLQQKDLSRRQARWQELLGKYDFDITYIRGEDNVIADALSRFPNEPSEDLVSAAITNATNSNVFNITCDKELLTKLRTSYKEDAFCTRLLENPLENLAVSNKDGLLFLGERLVIPRAKGLRELFCSLAHDSLGHFGVKKSFASLRKSYYWPGMRKDLENSYIPSCEECQRNKNATKAPAGPLHPLPIADKRGDRIFIDFIGPLPKDKGFNYLCTITDQLNSDYRLIPCNTEINAERFAKLFFDVWYCDNGLPLEIVSDRDHLFTSKFWAALHSLSGVKLKMSTAFHPQTDGASERTNKTVIQALRYFVDRQQKGWVDALPRVRFAIMNTKNESTNFSPFELRMGRSPRIIPPIVPNPHPSTEQASAFEIIQKLDLDCTEARDALIYAKVNQAHFANQHRSPEEVYQVGDFVMLSTRNRRRDYMQQGDGRTAKFMPRWDGKYRVIAAHPETSTYRIDLNGQNNKFATFHASQLK